MNPSTNVLPLPGRRRSDPPPAEMSRRSSPAFAGVPVLPPSPLDEPFADAMVAADRQRRANAAAAAAARRMAEALTKQKLRQQELRLATEQGFEKGSAHGWREGWFWGVVLGVLIGGSLVAASIKAGAWIVSKL